MVETIKAWYAAYGTATKFIGHKLTHILVGVIVGLFAAKASILLAVLAILVVGVAKEVSDHYKTIDPTTGKSYIPVSYHALDVIVTTLGGAAGIGLCLLISGVIPVICAGMVLILGIAAAIDLAE